MSFILDVLATMFGDALSSLIPESFWAKRWVRIVRVVMLVLVGLAFIGVVLFIVKLSE